MALVFYRPTFWLLIILTIAFYLWLARRIHIRWFPALITRIFIVLVILWEIFLPLGNLSAIKQIPEHNTIMVLDQSDSIALDYKNEFQSKVVSWLSESPDRIGVVFGADHQIVTSPDDPWPVVDSSSTNLASALALGSRLLGKSPGKIILISDGMIENQKDLDDVLRRMIESRQTLDVVPIPVRANSNDVIVGEILTPSKLWENTPFSVLVPVFSPNITNAIVKFSVNTEIQEFEKELNTGVNYLSFPIQASDPGIMTIGISLQLEGDETTRNNSAFATVYIYPSPRVLLVSKETTLPEQFATTLRSNGVDVTTVLPKDLPVDLKKLMGYDVVILHDQPLFSLAINDESTDQDYSSFRFNPTTNDTQELMGPIENLTQEQGIALKVFVSKWGRGLIFLGGRSSYTLGGYRNTIIEPILPIKMEPPPRKHQTPVALLLVLDRSSSMSVRIADVSQMDLAREAALRAIETLKSNDFMGVLTYEDEPYWDVPVDLVGDGLLLRQSFDAVTKTWPGGGTKIFAALQEAVAGLSEINGVDSRHILLLSDGMSYDGTEEEFQSLVEYAASQGITISTIALGRSDLELMYKIAAWGNGNFYTVLSPQHLPDVMVAESRAGRSEHVQLGETGLAINEDGHPILFGVNSKKLPTISGYNALSSKANQGAEDILLSANFSDPILSVWEYGLGRVVTWSSDIGEEWATGWTTWPDRSAFWTNVVRYALPNPSQAPANAEVHIDGNTLDINVQLFDEEGEPINLAQVVFTFADSLNTAHFLSVPQVQPGIYRLETVPPPEGAYRAVVEYETQDSNGFIPMAFSVNYPSEYSTKLSADGKAELDNWAKRTGGKVISLDDIQEIPEMEAGPDIDVTKEKTHLYTLVGLIIFWPIEIALRRQWMPWRT